MPKLTIYTTPTCPWCKKTKAFLKKKKISYAEKDVASDEKARNDMLRKSRQSGVPVLDIGGKIIVGFDPEGILKALTHTKEKAGKKKTAPKRKKTRKSAKKRR